MIDIEYLGALERLIPPLGILIAAIGTAYRTIALSKKEGAERVIKAEAEAYQRGNKILLENIKHLENTIEDLARSLEDCKKEILSTNNNTNDTE